MIAHSLIIFFVYLEDLYSDSTADPPAVKQRQSEPEKPKPKPESEESSPPPPKNKSGPNPETPPVPNSPPVPPSPPNAPSRRFFTSLFSIPGAVMDTLINGEIVL
ncbi:unnamed protein product [Spodoptera littoralis]|uniref:Uncharacterized protein n=1 Tax=Spodoptera littoralis TaxID=7109 RepID=A0A9P0I874_SPOLI|nr:unnamed protein product [Spodoptera littoralis]CAH1642834.1 unnamed protein product [Spodoptera littoralis]